MTVVLEDRRISLEEIRISFLDLKIGRQMMSLTLSRVDSTYLQDFVISRFF